MPLDVNLLPPNVDNLSTSIAEPRARIVSQLEEAQRLAKQNTERTQQQMKERYDLKTASVSFAIGQRVWVFTPKTKKGLSKKLLHRWHGPYRIVKQLSPVNFQLRNSANRLVATPVHVNRMKPFYDAKDRPIEPPTDDDDDNFALTEDELPESSFAPDTPNVEGPSDTIQTTGSAVESVDGNQRTQDSTINESASLDTSNEEIYKIEKILKTRKRKGK